MAAPYRVVSPLPTLAGLERFLAEDASGSRAWVYQTASQSPGADDRLLAAAGLCAKPQVDLVPVLDLGRDGAGRAWVATAPVPGSTLTQLIADHAPLDVALVVRIIARVAELLETLGALGLFPALPPEAVLVAGTQVNLLAFSPLPPPQAHREQARALGTLLDAALPVEGRRPDVLQVVQKCLVDGSNAFARPSEVAAALHAIVGGDTRQSATPGGKSMTLMTRSRAGEVLGSYELVKPLGEGGMGDVYLARHTRLGREVALKLLKPALATDADVVRRFFQEARVVNEINHPHIVEVIDFVDQPPDVFCVMEHLKGSTLADLALEAPLPLARTAHLLQQTCAALHAAHTCGVVHRDVKPANIFICERDGHTDFVKLLDFGIARLLRVSGKDRTQVGMVIGTPAYMSPEQAQGRPVDARTDIYAIGAVLFELLGGETLARAEQPGLPDKTVLGEPIPRVLVDLVGRCLSMEPTLRPASALEIANLLSAVAAGAPPDTTQRTIAAAGLGPSARSRGWVKFAAGAAALAVAGIGWLLRTPEVAAVTVPAPPELQVVAVQPVIDAGAAVAAVVPEPPPKLDAPAPKKHGGRDPLVTRFLALKKNYKQLVDRHGASGLTSLERAQVGQSLEDYANGDTRALAGSLPDAEKALKIASQRLGP